MLFMVGHFWLRKTGVAIIAQVKIHHLESLGLTGRVYRNTKVRPFKLLLLKSLKRKTGKMIFEQKTKQKMP